MILVDTSVWIDYFRGNATGAVSEFEHILERAYPFGLTGVIYQELLQGAKSKAGFDKLAEYLRTQRLYSPRDPIESHAHAARIYFQCRRAGVTVRSSIDCLIAAIAIEHNLLLLHDDRDYDAIASVISQLKLY